MKEKARLVIVVLVLAFLAIPACDSNYQIEVSRQVSVFVDYERPLSQMIWAGKYHWVNSDINSEHFSVEGEGRMFKLLHLVLFKNAPTTNEILAELNKEGLRPATLAELLALAEKIPDPLHYGSYNKYRGGNIVALGSFWGKPDGVRSLVYLGEDEGRFFLNTLWDKDGARWFDTIWFLAVSK